MEISTKKSKKEMNDSLLEFKQHSVNLFNSNEKKKKERKKRMIIFFIGIFLYLIFTVADIIIQYKNNIGKNNLLIDDYIFISGIILIIITVKCNKVYYCYLVYHCLAMLENLVNDIIFFALYIKKYKKSRHIFNFFISYCVIKFVASYFLFMIYALIFGNLFLPLFEGIK